MHHITESEIMRDVNTLSNLQQLYETRGMTLYKRMYIQDDGATYFKMYDRICDMSWRFRMWLPSDEVPHGNSVVVYAPVYAL